MNKKTAIKTDITHTKRVIETNTHTVRQTNGQVDPYLPMNSLTLKITISMTAITNS